MFMFVFVCVCCGTNLLHHKPSFSTSHSIRFEAAITENNCHFPLVGLSPG